MKKILIGLILGGCLISPLMVNAGAFDWILGKPELPTEEYYVWDTINTVVNWAFAALLAGAMIVIMIAAYNFLTAAGDPDKTKKARDYVLYALIAVVVGFLSKAIVALIKNMLGVGIGF